MFRRFCFLFLWLGVLALLIWGCVVDHSLDEQNKRTEELNRRKPVIVGHSQAKRQAFEALLDGRANLFQTATRFRMLDQTAPSLTRDSAFALPGKSVEERYCRKVIFWVRTESRLFPSGNHIDYLANDLEAELTEHLHQHHDAVILPDP